MSALDRIPPNPNLLPPLGFKFLIKKLPNVEFWLQHANLPGFTIPNTNQPTPFISIPHSGEHIEYQPLEVMFKVDEDMSNYIELHNWMRGLGFPDSFEEHKALSDAGKAVSSGEGLFSDASLIILSNLKNPNIDITFRDCFPVSMGELNFETTADNVIHIDCRATFRYTLFDVTLLP